jgi:hypothetical protein
LESVVPAKGLYRQLRIAMFELILSNRKRVVFPC